MTAMERVDDAKGRSWTDPERNPEMPLSIPRNKAIINLEVRADDFIWRSLKSRFLPSVKGSPLDRISRVERNTISLLIKVAMRHRSRNSIPVKSLLEITEKF